MNAGPFLVGQRVWVGDLLHEVVAAMPGAPWPEVYTRIIGRRLSGDNVVDFAAAKQKRLTAEAE